MKLIFALPLLQSLSATLALASNPPLSNCVTQYGRYSLLNIATFTKTVTVTSTRSGSRTATTNDELLATITTATPTVNPTELADAPELRARAKSSSSSSPNVHASSHHHQNHPSILCYKLGRLFRLISAFFGSTAQYNALLAQNQDRHDAYALGVEAATAPYAVGVLCTRTLTYIPSSLMTSSPVPEPVSVKADFMNRGSKSTRGGSTGPKTSGN